MRRWAVWFTCIVGLGATWLDSPARASGTGHRVVLILSVPGIAPEDLTSPEVPALRKLATTGAIGWMNARAGDSGGSHARRAAGYLTLGAGVPALAPAPMDFWRQVDIDAIRSKNRELPHAVAVGALGDSARRAGLRLEVVGDADDTDPHRECVLLAMDSSGQVDEHRLASTFDVHEPYGRRSNLDAYQTPMAGTLAVWEYSDLLRARRYAEDCLPAVAEQHVRRALQRLNALLEQRYLPALEAWQTSKAPYLAWLLSPMPAPTADPVDELSPVVAHGTDVQGGLLTSPTTRTVGLIANFDIAPTILAFLGLPAREEFFGRPVRVVKRPAQSAEQWQQLHTVWLLTATAQARFGGAAFLRILWVSVLLVALWFTLQRPSGESSVRWLAAVAGASLAPVLPQVLSGFFPPVAASVGTAVLLLAASLAGFAASRRRAARWTAGAIAGAVWAVVVADVALGAHHVGRSWLGHSVMYGIRYYGIGNELAGAWLGCLATLLAVVPLRLRYTVGAVLGTVSAVLAALPSGGANLGASIGMLGLASSCTVLAVPPQRRIVALAALVAGTLALLVAVIAWTDYGAAATHLGRAMHSGSSVAAIAARKLAVNLRLIATTRWSLLLAIGLVAVFAAVKLDVRRFDRGLLAPLLGGTLALLVANDSGVVAAGVCLSVAAPALVLLALSDGTKAPEAERVGHHGDG